MDGRTRHGETRLPLQPAAFLASAALLVILLAIGACGGEAGDTETTAVTEAAGVLLTVEQALDLPARGVPAQVSGSLFVDEDGTRLCSALLESFPPQCAEPSLAVEGLDIEQIVALERASSDDGGIQQENGESGAAADQLPLWTSYPLALTGTVDGDVLTVTEQPPVAVSSSGSHRFRFSYSPFPLRAGTVAWALEVVNTGEQPLDLTFPTGRRIEVLIRSADASNGEPVYRWSEGRAFTQAAEIVTIAPGETLPLARTGTLEDLEPGDYLIVAEVAAEGLAPLTMDAQPIVAPPAE